MYLIIKHIIFNWKYVKNVIIKHYPSKPLNGWCHNTFIFLHNWHSNNVHLPVAYVALPSHNVSKRYIFTLDDVSCCDVHELGKFVTRGYDAIRDFRMVQWIAYIGYQTYCDCTQVLLNYWCVEIIIWIKNCAGKKLSERIDNLKAASSEWRFKFVNFSDGFVLAFLAHLKIGFPWNRKDEPKKEKLQSPLVDHSKS